MDLRPHETDPKLTVATYQDEEEAQRVAVELTPLYKKIPYSLGISNGVDIHKDGSLTVLDDGRIEMAHRTSRLARFAGRLTRQSASHLNYQPEGLSSYAKETQALNDKINQYISNRTMSVPTRPEWVKPVPTPSELARTEAFKEIKQPYERTFRAGFYGFISGSFAAMAGRVVEAFAVNPNTPDHVNETVRQIANDMSYGGVAVAGLGLVTSIGIAKGWMRDERNFDTGWNEASHRLDPDGQIETSLHTEIPQVESPIQNDK